MVAAASCAARSRVHGGTTRKRFQGEHDTDMSRTWFSRLKRRGGVRPGAFTFPRDLAERRARWTIDHEVLNGVGIGGPTRPEES